MDSYKRFKVIIDRKGITEHRIVQDTGVYESIFTKWKKGLSKPKYENMKRLADYVGVNVDELMD